MVRNRKGLAPWSLAREAGIESATVDGTIEVPQYVQPVIDTGFVDEKGNWKGTKSSDKNFSFYQKDEAIANSATFLTAFGLDMTGFEDITLALKPTNGGNYAIYGVMGSSGSQSYANLNPLNDAATLRGNTEIVGAAFDALLADGSESMTADVWNIIMIRNVLRNCKLLQFKITNNSGDISTVETTFLRSVAN